MTILVWACYPIVWLFSEGFASFSVSFEITMYAILDVINKVCQYLLLSASVDALLVRVSVQEAVGPAWLLSNTPVLRLQLAAEDKTEDSTRTEDSTVRTAVLSLLACDLVRRRRFAHGLGLTEGVHNTQCVLCFMVMSAQDAIGDDTAGNREYV
jgi:hypothetical protein